MSTKKSTGIGVNIGSSSLLLIFVVLCLVSFAALSIVSSYADKRLGDRILTRSTSYYKACYKAEKAIASIDQTLRNAYKSAENETAYFEEVGTDIRFTEPISDLQELEIELTIQYPLEDGDTFYTVKKYCVINKDNIEYDDSLSVVQ